MPKLLVNSPSGKQEIIEISQSGSYFDISRVLWDERDDGQMPEVALGKMQRVDGALATMLDYTPEHQQYLDGINAANVADKTAKLWAAADAYIYATINGVAIAMLSLGVAQGKPKALAIAAWCDSIWSEYYIRKAAITVDTEPNLDFSNFGDKPYTVLELREEVEASWVSQP